MSRTRNRCRRIRRARAWAPWISAVALGLMGAIARAQTVAAAPLDALMQLLAQRRQGEADFDETQYLAVLKQPLHSSGVLLYVAPDHLEQRTVQPRPTSVVLDHNHLTLTTRTHIRQFDLADYPQVAALVNSIRATLAGDRAALEQVFTLQLQGDLAHWTLHLTARDATLAASLRDIQIEGEQADLHTVVVQQRNGDHSVLQIHARD